MFERFWRVMGGGGVGRGILRAEWRRELYGVVFDTIILLT
jgi:hypothetical protein